MNMDDTLGELTINVRNTKIDLRVFIENYLWITDKDSHLIPFKLNYEQQLVYRKMCELHHSGNPMFINLLKARQMGMSTFIAAVFFSYAMFVPNSNYVVVADIREHASNIFRKYEMFYQYLNHYDSKLEAEINEYEEKFGRKHEADLRPTLSTKAKGKVLETLSGHSSISVVAADKAAGRSSTLRGLHASEVAFWKNPNETFTSMTSTISITNPESMIFKETTANGFNDYKTMWDRDSAGNTGNAAVFIPWFKHEEYRIPEKNMPGKLPVMDEWIYSKLREHPEISDAQILWYWRRACTMASKADVLQEYPFDPVDAFKSSGQSVFDTDLIEKRKNAYASAPKPTYGRFTARLEWSRDNSSISVSRQEFEEMSGGPWKIYEKPMKGEPYVAICDPTKGFNVDYSAIQVFDNITGRQVAVYQSNQDDLDEVGKQLLIAGYWYNNALISSENNTGPKVLEMAVKARYPKIYYQQDAVTDSLGQRIRPIPGHNTNRGNRSAMITDAKLQFRNDPECIRDYDTLCEMETFQLVEHNGTFKEEAAGRNFHDDLIMAWAPFQTVRSQQSFSNDGRTETQTRTYTPSQYNEMVIQRRMEEKRDQVEVDDFGIRW